MSKIERRHFLKEKEKKLILYDFFKTFRIDIKRLFGPKPRIEVAETSRYQLIIVNDLPALVKSDDDFYPTLLFKEIFPFLPRIVVDMGAVPHICNGADIMAPGILSIHGDFKEKDIVVVVDGKHGKPIAIGRSFLDSGSVKRLKKGKVLQNLHHVGDELWNVIKNIVIDEKVKT